MTRNTAIALNTTALVFNCWMVWGDPTPWVNLLGGINIGACAILLHHNWEVNRFRRDLERVSDEVLEELRKRCEQTIKDVKNDADRT